MMWMVNGRTSPMVRYHCPVKMKCMRRFPWMMQPSSRTTCSEVNWVQWMKPKMLVDHSLCTHWSHKLYAFWWASCCKADHHHQVAGSWHCWTGKWIRDETWCLIERECQVARLRSSKWSTWSVCIRFICTVLVRTTANVPVATTMKTAAYPTVLVTLSHRRWVYLVTPWHCQAAWVSNTWSQCGVCKQTWQGKQVPSQFGD